QHLMEREQAIRLMQDLLRRMVEKKGSALFITAGFPPAIKVDGEIRPQSDRSLSPEQSAGMVRAIMNDRQTKEFDGTKECDFASALSFNRDLPAPCCVPSTPRSPPWKSWSCRPFSRRSCSPSAAL